MGTKTTCESKCQLCHFVYDSEILDSEIISDDRCIVEYIPLGTPSPILTPTPTTIGIQLRDIQCSEHDIKADLECVR